jgi:hypothetical protein
MYSQRTGLGNQFGASLEHDHIYFCQGQFTGKPQPNRTCANDHDVKIITHHQRSRLVFGVAASFGTHGPHLV